MRLNLPRCTFAPLVSAALALACGGGTDADADASSSQADASAGDATVSSEAGEDASESGASSEASADAASESSGGDGDGDCVDWRPGMTPSSETLTLTTSDQKELAATLSLPGEATCRPAILLVHQYQQSQSQWGDFGLSLAARGFVVLAIDLRGHGMSDPQDGSLSELLSDPDQAPLDVRAGVDALAGHAAVDPQQLAVFGTSIGANLAVAVQHSDERVRRSVALSPRLDPTLSLAGSPASITPHDLYCIAGELDGGGDQAQSCDTLASAATGSAQSVVLAGSGAHGVTIFADFPEEVENAVVWLEGLAD